MPHRSGVAQPWRMRGSRYRMVGGQCKKCGNMDFPFRKSCSSCGSHETAESAMSGKGSIMSFTVIHTAPEGFEGSVPYAIGLVKLEEGPVVTAQISGDRDGLGIGKQVRAVFRKLYAHGSGGLIHYGFKFEIEEQGE